MSKTLTGDQQDSLTNPDNLTRCIKIEALHANLGFTQIDKTLAIDLGDGDGEINYLPGLDLTSTDQTKELSIEDADISGLIGTIATSVQAQDIRAGYFSGVFYKTFLYDHAKPLFISILKAGHIGSAEIRDDDLWIFEGPGLSQKLTKPLLSVTQAECRYDVFDSFCTASTTGFIDTGTVTQVLDVRSDFVATLSTVRADNFHQFGRVTWSTGNNSSARPMDVKAHKNFGSPAEDRITLELDMGKDIQVGDTFSIRAGCDHKINGDCLNKFNNVVNFGGEPFIPGRDKIRQVGEG